jgi:hypothetical protein
MKIEHVGASLGAGCITAALGGKLVAVIITIIVCFICINLLEAIQGK